MLDLVNTKYVTSNDDLDIELTQEFIEIDLNLKVKANKPQQLPSSQCGAYILFTSGSTGIPKALLRTHSDISAPLHYWLTQDTYHSSLLRSPMTHSPFLWELLYPLASGNTLIIAGPHELASTSGIISLIKKHNIQEISISPAHLKALLTNTDFTSLSSLRLVECSGEAIPHNLIKDFHNSSNAILSSTYGCTEAPSIATNYFNRDDEISYNLLGDINKNLDVQVLDKNYRPIDIDQSGEIYVAGDKVASSYINNQEETNKRFIPLTIDGKTQKTYFKTGDLARRNSHGELEFVGRIDRQIQVNGFRVEPSEVETELTSHRNINEAVVLMTEHINGNFKNLNLTAYIVCKNKNMDVNQIRSYLSKKIADYKIPRLIIFIPEIPKNQHNKIDYQNLSKNIDLYRPRHEDIENIDLSPLEKSIAKLFKRSLRIEDIHPDDDFYILGGTSLSAAELLLLLEHQLGIKLTHKEFMYHASVRSIAQQAYENKKITRLIRRIDFFREVLYCKLIRIPHSFYNKQKKLVEPWIDVFEYHSKSGFLFGFNTEGQKTPIFWCCPNVNALTYLAETLGKDQPIYGFRSSARIFKTWKDKKKTRQVANFYTNEILKIQSKGSFIIGGNCNAADIAKEIADRLTKKKHYVQYFIPLNMNCIEELNDDYQTILIYGENDRYNPFRDNPKLSETLNSSISTAFVTGEHGKYFTESSDFTSVLSKIISQDNNN